MYILHRTVWLSVHVMHVIGLRAARASHSSRKLATLVFVSCKSRLNYSNGKCVLNTTIDMRASSCAVVFHTVLSCAVGFCVKQTEYSGIPVNSSHSEVVTRSSRQQLTRHRSTRHICVSSHSQLVTTEHTTKPSTARQVVFSPTKTVINTDGLITTNEQTYGGVLKLTTNKEKKTEGLEMKVKLLRKYLVWKKTK